MTFWLQLSALEEQRKRLAQELECQRHNAEAARQAQETKFKAKEHEHNLELGQQTDLLRDAQRHLDELNNKLKQEGNKVGGCGSSGERDTGDR